MREGIEKLREALKPLAEQDCESWGCGHPAGGGPCEPKNARDAIITLISASKKGLKSEYEPSRHEHEHGALLVSDCDGWCRSKFESYLRNLRADVKRLQAAVFEASGDVAVAQEETKRLRGDMGMQRAFIEGFKVDMEEQDATIATLRSGYETAAKRLHNTEDHATLAGLPFEFCEISICKLNREALAIPMQEDEKESPCLRSFVLAILEHFGNDECMELDCCDFQELATKFGIIKWEKYDPERHGEGHDMDPGDEIWLPNVDVAEKV